MRICICGFINYFIIVGFVKLINYDWVEIYVLFKYLSDSIGNIVYGVVVIDIG